ncbi:hypothetical protein WMY93_021958 [Mugilogobius chulae]|uniref:Uncharacterized protein n=1 Tax=Mugilogobius chulae TaxID=88201 RepID=A0AAW0NCC0_9GOBI
MDNFPEHLLSLDPPSQQEISQNLVGEEETWRRTTVKERSTHMDGQAVDVMLQTISMDHSCAAGRSGGGQGRSRGGSRGCGESRGEGGPGEPCTQKWRRLTAWTAGETADRRVRASRADGRRRRPGPRRRGATARGKRRELSQAREGKPGNRQRGKARSARSSCRAAGEQSGDWM